jgi:hypothetical protein
MKRSLPILLAILALASFTVRAQEMPPRDGFKPDDKVIFDVSAEDWVTTKTAHVVISVQAAVTANTAGSTRGDMTKAVNDLAKADWRLTSFDRSQDQTGMERWSANFEARLPENELGGLSENAKKASKQGMQLSVGMIDFSPTLDEMETVRAGLRGQIYKIANDQLAALNSAIPGRNYRIAVINFTGDDDAPMPRVMKGQRAMAMMAPVAMNADATQAAPMERAEKASLSARVVFAASPAEGKPGAPALPPVSPPDLKR